MMLLHKLVLGVEDKFLYLSPNYKGELAQLARALAWHARGHRFDSGILHKITTTKPLFSKGFFLYRKSLDTQM